MSVFLTIEAGQPNGTTYRLAFGVQFAPMLASMMAALARLF